MLDATINNNSGKMDFIAILYFDQFARLSETRTRVLGIFIKLIMY